jgi:hypothetical protein
MTKQSLNVLGEPLISCGLDPLTGYHRKGNCTTGEQDFGRHLICAVVTEGFLAFTRSKGNDLITPIPAFDFPGLKDGDRWCLCVDRWLEALEANVAPPVVLQSTHIKTLRAVELSILMKFAVDSSSGDVVN